MHQIVDLDTVGSNPISTVGECSSVDKSNYGSSGHGFESYHSPLEEHNMMFVILVIGCYFFAFGLVCNATDGKILSKLIFKVTPALCGLFLILYAVFSMGGITIGG